MGSLNESYIIVGAGIFGASTSLHLKKAKPGASITLIDRTPFPNPSAASHDLNKIVRADYADIFYMKLALEAVHHWRHDALYRDFYHETGMAFAETIGMGRAAVKNYRALGADVKAEILTPEDMRARFGGVFKDSNWDGAQECFWNARSGWGEAEGALRNTIQDAISRGVKYYQTTVNTLSLDNKGACTGVYTSDGELLIADRVILCTGALTAKLLTDTAPRNKKLHVSGRLVAAGAVSCIARVPQELISKFKRAPVFFNGLEHTHGESVPVTDDGLVKFNHELSFTHLVYDPVSQQHISIPPKPVVLSTWGQDVPEGLKNEVENVVWNTYGRAAGITIESYRMCWDALTPNQDFIISPHPHCPRLYLATGGSFHAWKFLPVIGKYVVKLLDGVLDEVATRRWAWDRENDGAACVMYIPRRDLKDIRGWAELKAKEEEEAC